MDPRLLSTFVTVVRLGSFSDAASELGYTQSAVSQHIAALEADLGVPLLHRRPVAPTDSGARLLEHARPLLLRLAAARADVLRAAAPPSPRLAVGASPLAARARLADALAEVRRRMPGVEVTVRVLGRTELPSEVATGRLDAALVDGMAAPTDPLRLPDAGPLSVLGIGETPLAVVLPGGHPLAVRQGVALADLADARWIDAPDVGAPLAGLRVAIGAPRSGTFRPALRYDGTEPLTLLDLVAAGHGLAVLPLPVVAAYGGAVRAVPLTVPALVHRVELVRPTTPTPAAGALADALGT